MAIKVNTKCYQCHHIQYTLIFFCYWYISRSSIFYFITSVIYLKKYGLYVNIPQVTHIDVGREVHVTAYSSLQCGSRLTLHSWPWGLFTEIRMLCHLHSSSENFLIKNNLYWTQKTCFLNEWFSFVRKWPHFNSSIKPILHGWPKYQTHTTATLIMYSGIYFFLV